MHFDLKDGGASTPTCTLTLTNSSDEIVAYKIKTTTPKRYLVKPNQELLLAGASISVTVVLEAKEAQAMVEQPLSTMDNKDKFLIATVLVDDAFVSAVNAARSSSPKEVQTLFTNLWEKKDKEDFKNLRLGCKFTLPHKVSVTSPSTPVPAAPKPTTPTNADKKPLTATPVAPAPMSADDDAAVTQSKYKDLLTLLVQVTDERDRFQSSYKDASKELMALKEAAKKGGGSVAVKSAAVATYQVWHLLLVAVVAFVAGRLVSSAF